MRKSLIAGNWKMHGSTSSVNTLIEDLKAGASNFSAVDMLICPSFVHIAQVASLLNQTPKANILWGAQNLYPGGQGAFTGEVSGAMLKELGCSFVLVGHSERRTLFHEDSTLVAQKFIAAQTFGLTPILCVGETREEREGGLTEEVVQSQLQSVIDTSGIKAFASAVIAYEPVWAIGTGLTATPQEAQEVHAFIRRFITQNSVDIGDTIRILYGGSMKADNAASLLTMPDIDGGLIGGASLDAASFLKICAAANTIQPRESGHLPKIA